MNNELKYLILSSDMPNTLAEKVNCMLSEGYELYGYPFASTNGESRIFHQAVINFKIK